MRSGDRILGLRLHHPSSVFTQVGFEPFHVPGKHVDDLFVELTNLPPSWDFGLQTPLEEDQLLG